MGMIPAGDGAAVLGGGQRAVEAEGTAVAAVTATAAGEDGSTIITTTDIH